MRAIKVKTQAVKSLRRHCSGLLTLLVFFIETVPGKDNKSSFCSETSCGFYVGNLIDKLASNTFQLPY